MTVVMDASCVFQLVFGAVWWPGALHHCQVVAPFVGSPKSCLRLGIVKRGVAS
jgi:hypothetical protein